MAGPKTFTFAIAGAGTRGEMFARWLVANGQAGRVTAVADPAPSRRAAIAELCGLGPEGQFDSWQEMLDRPRLADAVINTTMDRSHAEVCLAAFPKGYHMLLEKPMGTTLGECLDVDRLARENGCIVAVCHSLRYVPVWLEVKRLIDEGALGDLITIDQISGVGPEHFAHSYVRGNWARASDGVFGLMAKCCHDIDQIAWMAGRPCRRAASFGHLTVFRRENLPAGAPEFCVRNCPHEPTCLYSAIRIYGPNPIPHRWEQAKFPPDGNQRLELLKTSPYGRCVWHCDNDCPDHQVVALDFDGGLAATFTMTAFRDENRLLRITGTRASLEADLAASRIELQQFGRPGTQVLSVPADEGLHGGGDERVIRTLVEAMRAGDSRGVASSTAETLATHKIVFAAERARLDARVVDLAEL